MAAVDPKIKTIRDDIKADDKLWANKPRYALFSYTPNPSNDLVMQKNSPSRKEVDGRVRIGPKEIMTSKSDLFSKTGFLSDVTKYVDSSKIKPWRTEDMNATRKLHKNPFNSTSFKSKTIGAAYEHLPDKTKEIIVGFGNKGIVTSSSKTGHLNTTVGHLFSKPFEYIEDPYENKGISETKHREKEKSKMMGRKAFISNSPKREYFMSSKDTFASPMNNSARLTTSQLREKNTPRQNEKPFVPSSPAKIGFNRTFNKFPEYMSDPLSVFNPDNKKKELIWRYNYNGLTGPTASIKQYNEKNRPRGIIKLEKIM